MNLIRIVPAEGSGLNGFTQAHPIPGWAFSIWGSKMMIFLNGRNEEASAKNLMELVLSRGLKPEVVVAEKNGTIIKRTDWENTPLMDGDQVELVSFVGGG